MEDKLKRRANDFFLLTGRNKYRDNESFREKFNEKNDELHNQYLEDVVGFCTKHKFPPSAFFIQHLSEVMDTIMRAHSPEFILPIMLGMLKTIFNEHNIEFEPVTDDKPDLEDVEKAFDAALRYQFKRDVH